MADDKTVKMTAPNGATVDVAASKVDNLLRRGFTKTTTKKASSSKSEK